MHQNLFFAIKKRNFKVLNQLKMRFDYTILIAILSVILDSYYKYFNYSFTALLLFFNIVGLYLFLSRIEITVEFRYNR